MKIIKNCRNCRFSHITGGQVGYAESKGLNPEYLGYKYCGKHSKYVYDNQECADFKKKITLSVYVKTKLKLKPKFKLNTK